jgi:NhaC family Na+:H+ antiporter
MSTGNEVKTEGKEKVVTTWQALILLGIIAFVMSSFAQGVLVGGVRVRGDFRIALMVIWLMLFIACAILKINWGSVWKACLAGIHSALGAIMILVCVGALIGAWMSSGTIAYVIRLGLMLIHPSVFFLTTLILTSLMSLFTGTSTGSAATAGVAMASVGVAMGMPVGITAGAAITGALFGDKISPLSDTTVYIAALHDIDLFSHIRSMLYTMIVPYTLSMLFFLFLGLRHYGGAGVEGMANVYDVIATLDYTMRMSPVTLIPLVIVIILLLKKFPVVPALIIGAFSGGLVAWLYQGVPFMRSINLMHTGFNITRDLGIAPEAILAVTGNPEAARIVTLALNRGGIMELAAMLILVLFAVGMGSILNKMGVIEAIIAPFRDKLGNVRRLTLFSLFVSYLTGFLTSTMTASNVLTSNLMAPVYREKGVAREVNARAAECGGTLGAPVIPYSSMSIIFVGFLLPGMDQIEGWLSFVPFLPLTYLASIAAIVCAFLHKGIWYTHAGGDNTRISREEHKRLYPDALPRQK